MRWMIAVLLIGSLAATAFAAPRPRINAAQAAATALERFAGEVIDVDLDDAERDEPAGQVYEVKLLTSTGDVVTIRISAQTGDYLGAEGRDLAGAVRAAPPRSVP